MRGEASSAASSSGTSRRHWSSSARSASCQNVRAIILTSASAGVGRRFRGRRRRSRVCTRTTSSWRPRPTSSPARERMRARPLLTLSPQAEGVNAMERRKASDFHPEVLRLFDGYIHGRISRRDFLDGAAKFAVGGFTAAAMLESLRPNYAWAQQVAKNDPRITTEYVTYPSPQGSGT